MNLGDVMDEVAQAVRAVPSLQGRTYAWAQQSITPPAAIIPFPEIEFDLTMGRGADRVPLSVVVLVESVDNRSNRDRVLGYIAGSGSESIKEKIEAHTYTSLDSVRVETASVQRYDIGDIAYLAVEFTLDIVGPGTT